MVTAKKAMTNGTKSEFTSHCRVAAKTNFLLFLFPARFAHARYNSRMIDRFLNWGDHGKPESGKIKGRCQPPLVRTLPRRYVSCSFVCLINNLFVIASAFMTIPRVTCHAAMKFNSLEQDKLKELHDVFSFFLGRKIR